MTARRVAVGTDQQKGPPTIPGQHAPDEAQNCGTSIGPLQFHVVVCSVAVVRINVVPQPHGFLDFAAVSLVLPDQAYEQMLALVPG